MSNPNVISNEQLPDLNEIGQSDDEDLNKPVIQRPNLYQLIDDQYRPALDLPALC